MQRFISTVFLMIFTHCVIAGNILNIELSDLSTQGDKVYLAVFNSDGNFMKKPFKAAIVEAKDSSAIAEFDLPNGNYAITVFQDENGNGKLDRGMFGIPKEKYGFSNNVKPTVGPPSFESCKIEIKGDTTIKIIMR